MNKDDILRVAGELNKCSCCKQELPRSDFFKDASRSSGLQSQCKKCARKRGLEYYEKNKDRKLAACAAHYAENRERLLEKKKEYLLTEHGRLSNNMSVRRWTEKNKAKREVHKMVRNAINNGALVRGTCEVCGCSTRVQGHHDDYAKPLSVRWLCILHHKQWHMNNGEGLNAQRLPDYNANEERKHDCRLGTKHHAA